MSTKTCNSSQTVQDRTKVTMIDYDRQVGTEINDLGWMSLNGRNVTLTKIKTVLRAHQKNFNEESYTISGKMQANDCSF